MLVYNPHCTSRQHETTENSKVSPLSPTSPIEQDLKAAGAYASLAKPKPARDPTLGLRCLPLHSLVKVVNRLVKLLFSVTLRLVELGCGIARKLFEFGLGLAHFGRYGLVGFVNFVTDITDLYASPWSI